MKKFFRIIVITISSIIGLIVIILATTILWISVSGNQKAKKSMALAVPEVKTLTIEGFTFRDLNKNGKLDKYEDIRCPQEERVNDLLLQMNLEEKAGMMFHTMVSMKKDGNLADKPSLKDPFSFLITGTSEMILGKKMNHLNILAGTGKGRWLNGTTEYRNLPNRQDWEFQ